MTIRGPFLQRISTPDALPRYEYLDRLPLGEPRTVFVSATGGRWEIVDLVGPPDAPLSSCERRMSPSSAAWHRLFTYRDGTMRVYHFAPGEHRGFCLRPGTLQGQLERSDLVNAGDGSEPTMADWNTNQKRRRATEAWLADLDRRMSQADNPAFTPEERLDAMAALMSYANHKLPDGHPQKITEEDIARLTRARDAGSADLAAKLGRLLPPAPSTD